MRLFLALSLAGVALAGGDGGGSGSGQGDITFEEMAEWNEQDVTCKNSYAISKTKVGDVDACKTKCENESNCSILYFDSNQRKNCALYNMEAPDCLKMRNAYGTNYLKIIPTSMPTTMPSAPPTTPPTFDPTTMGMLEFDLMIMPAMNVATATTANAVSVKFLKGDGTWTDKMELFSSCDVADQYCGKEFLIDADTVTKVMFMNEGKDNFKTGLSKMTLNGMPVYLADYENFEEWVTKSKNPEFDLTSVAPCPEATKSSVMAKIKTASKDGADTTDQVKMALKLKCNGWVPGDSFNIPIASTGLGETSKYSDKRIKGEVEAIMLYKDGFDPWYIQKIDLAVAGGDKQKVNDKPYWLGDINNIPAAVFPQEKTKGDIKKLCKKIARNGKCASDCSYAFSSPALQNDIPDWLTEHVCNEFPGNKYTELCPEECGIKPLCAKISMEGKCAEDCQYAFSDSSYFTFLPNWLIEEICRTPDGKYTELCPMDCPMNKLLPTTD